MIKFRLSMKEIKHILVPILLIFSSFLAANAKEVTLPVNTDLQNVYQNKDIQIKQTFNAEVSTSKEIDIPQLLDIAIQNNPKIHKEILESGVFKLGIKQARGSYLPEFQFGSGFYNGQTSLGHPNINLYPRGFSDFMYGRISLSQLLCDFGYTSKKIAVAKEYFELSKIQIESAINNIIFDVKDKYYYLALANIKSDLTKNYYQKLKTHRKLIDEHYKNEHPKLPPVAKITDDATLEFRLALCEKLQNDAFLDIELTQKQLKNITGQPYCDDYKIKNDLSIDPIKVSPETLIKIANVHRPELKYARAKILLKEKNTKLVKKEIMPSMNLFASYGLGGATYERDSYNPYGSYRLGAMISTPFINPVVYKQKIEEAKLAENYQKADGLQVAYDTYLEIQNAYLNYNNEIKNLEKAKIALKKTKTISHGFDEMYRIGGGCYILVVDYTYEVYKAQLDYYNALYRINRQKAALDKAVGKIITKEDTVDL